MITVCKTRNNKEPLKINLGNSPLAQLTSSEVPLTEVPPIG